MRENRWKFHFALHLITTPSVVGAVICLDKCLDFMEIANLQKLKKVYDEMISSERTLPKNTGRDFYKRNLDCFLINYFVAQEKFLGNKYDSVRSVFLRDTNFTKC